MIIRRTQMKHLLAIAFITLLALGTGCAWISPSSQTTSDAIQVHGHWTVTVTNPDGSVDAVHEFDNALGTDATVLQIRFDRLIIGFKCGGGSNKE